MLEAIKDIGTRQDKIVEWLQAINKKLGIVDNVLGAYVEMKGDTDGLQAHFKKLEEEQKAKRDSENNDKSSEEEE